MQKITQEEMNGERFQFGENGRAFSYALNEDRINFSKKDLLYFLGEKELTGRIFLNIGSGSGLFSLVAKMAGVLVNSFDYNLDSVACTEYLKEKHFPNDQNLIVELMEVIKIIILSLKDQFASR